MRAYFVYDFFRISGTKTETLLIDFAVKNFLHMLIYENRLTAVVESIKEFQDKVLEENKRLRPVGINLSDERYEWDGHRVLHIGNQSLRLRRVKDVIE